MKDAKPARERGLTLEDGFALSLLPAEGLRFEEEIPGPWLEVELAQGVPEENAARVTSPLSVRLDLRPLGPVESTPPLLVDGEASVDLRCTCVRCLSEVPLRLQVDLGVTLMPTAAAHQKPSVPARGTRTSRARAPGRSPQSVEPDRLEPALEAEGDPAYDPASIRLLEWVREAVVLEAPTHPRCADQAACDERTAALIQAVNEPVRGAPQGPTLAASPRRPPKTH